MTPAQTSEELHRIAAVAGHGERISLLTDLLGRVMAAADEESPDPEDVPAGMYDNAMTVGQLVGLLQKEDQSAPVGVSMSGLHGHVQEIQGLAKGPGGIIAIDQSDMSLSGDEVDLQRI